MHPLLRRRQALVPHPVHASAGDAGTLSPTASVVGTIVVLGGLVLLVTKMGVTHGTPRFRNDE